MVKVHIISYGDEIVNWSSVTIFNINENNHEIELFMKFISGQLHEEFLHATVSVWCVLCLCKAKGTRKQEHYLDCRMCCAAA